MFVNFAYIAYINSSYDIVMHWKIQLQFKIYRLNTFIPFLFFLAVGVHTCFVCKKLDKEVRRCMIPVCGKFYHMECILKYSPTVPQNRGFRCSLHVCLACFITNPANPGISKGDIISNNAFAKIIKKIKSVVSEAWFCVIDHNLSISQVAWPAASAALWPITPVTTVWLPAASHWPITASCAPNTSLHAKGAKTMNTSTLAGVLCVLKVCSPVRIISGVC